MLSFNMKKDITGVILAGGKNSRMGVNKAFLEIEGKRLIDNILDVYQTIFAEIIIVTNDPLPYTDFPDTVVVTDIYKGKGSRRNLYRIVLRRARLFFCRRLRYAFFK
jgi:molybdopterin-guanine dinucleotide biosynthesis protein A